MKFDNLQRLQQQKRELASLWEGKNANNITVVHKIQFFKHVILSL